MMTIFQMFRQKILFSQIILFLVAFFMISLNVNAQADLKATDSTKNLDSLNKTYQYQTNRLKGEPPIIDGKPGDAAWDIVEWEGKGKFQKIDPDDGQMASQETEFKLIYDDKFIYIIIHAHDTEPEKIVKRMSRRDGFEGDWVEVNIDSYHDKRTAFSFNLSAAGVKGDEYITNQDNWDSSWDPIWFAKASIDDTGYWTEFKIPLSQIRFGNAEVQSWGFQVNRRLFRKSELSSWNYISRKLGGWVNFFGTVEGLKGIKPQKQIELAPYIVTGTDLHEREAGNPYRSGQNNIFNAGIDGKFGITGDITLDFTINPDFGQVEADPSQVNLSAFQLFFREQRPFFTEGNNILDYRINPKGGGFLSRDNLFYSRRIGRSPQFSPDIPDGAFIDSPNNTPILGALKLTGKLQNGLSFGISESVTRETYAKIYSEGKETKEAVEPLTNYLVSRVQKDSRDGNTIIGGIFTATNRFHDNPNFNFLNTAAYSGGVDLRQFINKRKYELNTRVVFSNIQGEPEAITNAQNNSRRFFQNPDKDYVNVDKNRNSLTGTGASFRISKISGNYYWGTNWAYRSPELELNDIGFQRVTDRIDGIQWVGYRQTVPKKLIRESSIELGNGFVWNSQFDNTNNFFFVYGNMQFKNFWRFGGGTDGGFKNNDFTTLRGGPRFKRPWGFGSWVWLNSDPRKKMNVWLNYNTGTGQDNFRSRNSYSVEVAYQPFNRLKLSAEGNISKSRNDLQYVTELSNQDNPVYVFARIEQETVSLSFRLNYIINPNLTIQYWGQPFSSKGKYSQFKSITNPQANNFRDSYIVLDDLGTFENGDLNVDQNRDGTTDYTISDPNFNFNEFLSNMVLRWEYKPGSTLFLVWSQNRNGNLTINEGGRNFGMLNDVFDTIPENTFLVKFTYRLLK